MNRREINRVLLACAAFPVAAHVLTYSRAEQPITKIKLTDHRIGHPPESFEFRRTGFGERGQWSVVRDDTAASKLAIEQFSEEPTEDRFPLAVYAPISAKNVEVSARFKIIGGSMQSAGIAVRLTSIEDYYV